MARVKETLPYAPHSDTSRAAAKSMEDAAPTYEQMVLGYYLDRGPYGATADECLRDLQLSHQNGSARVSTLKKKGKLIESRARRVTRSGRKAAVLVHAEFMVEF